MAELAVDNVFVSMGGEQVVHPNTKAFCLINIAIDGRQESRSKE